MDFNKKGVGIFLAMPTHRDLHPLTVASLLSTQETVIKYDIPCAIEMQAGSSLVHHARSKAAATFLDSPYTHLFWIDSDIVWSAADFLRLVAFGTKMECVGGVYPAKREPVTIFININDPDAEVMPNEYGCLPVAGMGLGFTIVQRKVIEQLAVKAPKCRFPDVAGAIPHIFRLDDVGGSARGEDMAFFSDVAGLGYQVWLDPHIKLGHIGAKEYRADPRDFIVPSQQENQC